MKTRRVLRALEHRLPQLSLNRKSRGYKDVRSPHYRWTDGSIPGVVGKRAKSRTANHKKTEYMRIGEKSR